MNFEDVCRQLHVSGQGYVKSLGSYDGANFWVKVYKEGDLIYEDKETKWVTGYTGNFDFYTPITKGTHTFLVRRYTVMVPSIPAVYDANWTTRYVVENTDYTPCPDVTNLRSVSVTDCSVSLDWDDSTCTDFSKYGVYYKRSSETTWTRTQDRTSSNALVSGLLSSTSYDFKVTVWDTSANENSGSIITVRTDDADDIPVEIEEDLNKVRDVFGDMFPDPNKDDAYDTMTVAKEFYNGPSSSFKWYKENGKLLDLPTGDLANYAIFLAEYSRHLSETTDPKRSDVINDMKLILNELEGRQRTSLIGIPPEPVSFWPYKIYVHPRGCFKNYNGGILCNDLALIHTGYAGMAFFEGYDVLKDNASESAKANEYKNRAELAVQYLKRHMTERGFNSIGSDDFCGGIAGLIYGCRYADEADEEEINHGGDTYLSTANNYGNALRTYAHSCLKMGTYCDEIGWAADEVRRLQKRNGGSSGLNEGGIRDGPLAPSWVNKFSVPLGAGKLSRLNESIAYSGMTSFGVRQAYDATNDSNAYAVVTELAKHYYRIRNRTGVWPAKWNFENESILAGSSKDTEVLAWASVIQLNGGHITGFRQAITDAGDYRDLNRHYFAGTLYTALKKCGTKCDLSGSEASASSLASTLAAGGDDYIIFCKGCISQGYLQSEGSISQGQTRTRQILIDPTIKRIKFEIIWNNDTNADLDLTLTKPDGTPVNGPAPGINYTSNTTYEYYVVSNPDPGYWTMTTTAASVVGADEYFATRVTLDTTLNTEVNLNASYLIQNETLKILVTVKNDTTPITGAAVDVNITRPDGQIIQMPLYDDGTHGDSSPNDGNYTGIFQDTSLSGEYLIRAVSSGTFAGSPFTRVSITRINVEDIISPSVNITSPQNDAVVPTNFTLTWEGSDNSGILDYLIYIDNLYNGTTNQTSFTISGLNESNHTISVLALDNSGNSDIDEINITVNSTLTAYNLTLSPGWNLISIPAVPENTSLQSVLASIEGNYSVVYAWIGNGWKRSTDTRDPLTVMDTGYGYWIYANETGSYVVEN